MVNWQGLLTKCVLGTWGQRNVDALQAWKTERILVAISGCVVHAFSFTVMLRRKIWDFFFLLTVLALSRIIFRVFS